MGVVVVLLVLAGILSSYSIVITIFLIIISCIIIFQKQLQKWLLIFLAAFLIAFYFYNMYDFKREKLPFDFEPKVNTTGEFRFSDDLEIDGNLLMGSLTVQQEEYQFFYKINNEAEKERLQMMQLTFLSCSAQMSFQHILPNTNFSGFHYDAYLYYTHKRGSLKLTNVDWQNCSYQDLNMIEHIQKYRKDVAIAMYQSNIVHKGYLIALTLGDTSYLNKNEMSLLKTLGIYHLYAISGSHVALISVQFYFVLRRLSVPIIVCKMILLMLLPMYMIFTGSQPSVWRSTIFILLILFNPGLKTQLTDLLSLTFILNLIYDPFTVYDIGFQLSYVICFSFLLILPLYNEKSKLFQFFLINFISQLATIPILFYHFNNNYLIGMLTNIFFIPLFTFIIFPIYTLILLLFMLNIHINWLNQWVDGSFILNDMLTKFFTQFSRVEIILEQQHIFIYVLMFIALSLLFSKLKSYKGLSIALLLFLLIFTNKNIKENSNYVHFLDVGQGDAFILELGRKTIMIDTGGKLDFSKSWERRSNAQSISDKVTLPFLKYRGISKIDALILTHPDADHFGESENLIKAGMVERIILNSKAHGSEKYKNIIRLAQLKGIALIDVNNYLHEAQIQFVRQNENNNKNVSLRFLSAGQTGEENDDSIVVFLKHDKPGRNILFLGDLSKAYEDEILSQIDDAIDIVKIGHHGSRTSTSETLLSRHPKFAIISAGRHNRFKHPHNETVTALINNDIKIFNTQKNGRITVDLDRGTVQTQYQALFHDK
ncbi:DNA internalization-related competence protein ComEC/Rec2 [Macrococcus epidermidis]|uniref:DNA internalization-related competence protein ComEC/Rec2 n=1 Tax=Macrococcus epidermidis TaxID=1902580 RepID=A0A328A0K1_9STAP|nr:DNA internalization-related competence protein ComEC/Rec2 [Macrococcus epidermidis]RAK46918.1 DNA internalization-related competence protein ComEC/Rec2 [Macrococcus epidermidis]